MIKMQEEQSCNPRFSLLFLASWFFEKSPVERCAAAWRGTFLYLFDDHPDFAYNLDTIHFFLVKSPEK